MCRLPGPGCIAIIDSSVCLFNRHQHLQRAISNEVKYNERHYKAENFKQGDENKNGVHIMMCEEVIQE